jgi:anaphase-promoting complex subunit 8
LLCFPGAFDQLKLFCVQHLQEKETAKTMLQGIKREQSGFPSMDIDHFAL